jgi:signal transduction histidine kinase
MHIFWLLFFSLFAAVLFNYENNKKEKTDRMAFAEKLVFQSDPNTESLLSIALAKFDNNFLLKNIDRFYANTVSGNIKDTLLNENFVWYLNKFQTNIYTYDSLERPLQNKDSVSFSYFNTLLQNQATRVNNISDLFFLEVGFDLFSYIFKRSIVDTSGKVVGHFIVQSNPITYKNKSDALSPELFKQRNTRLDDKGNNYVYAIYNNYELRKRFFDYDLPTKIAVSEIPIQDDTLKYRNGYEELWVKLNKNSVVVVGKKNNNGISLITLFAYIFFSILFVIFILSLIEALFFEALTKKKLVKLFQMNFSKQVQGIVWLVSLITFIVVAFVIISLFKTRFNKTNKERLGRTMGILIADVQNKLNTSGVFDDVVKIYEPGANEALKETIFQMSEIHNVDFNIYDLAGTLKLSSQPLIESKGILSNKMNPMAYFNLQRKASAQVVQQEKMGSFEYLSMYVPIRDEQGKAYGYLNIPYYSSQSDLNQEISNFLITIINLTAFIFLIAGLIAWLVTSRITKSFNLIGNKMKEVSLGKNEIIEWTKEDEIGGLVKEYNRMVVKLEESATILAKTEREGAWREMARQVAHEIKNPLTPMKLSIQYLQKSIANGNTNVEDLANSVSKTLVEQIDHLSNIASDFSQFANIENSKMEKVDVAEMLKSLQQLFNTEENITIHLEVNTTNTTILADKTQINRLYTNLIKNATQAYEEDTKKKISIVLQQNNKDSLVVLVQDFGKGIPLHLKEKIFTPNFTTKTSGTGLGLAISKGIVENAKGVIQFSTEENKGTIFTTTFPIYI